MGIRISDYLREMGADVDGAVARFGGNTAVYEKFILRFIDDENFAKLKIAVSERNNDKLLFHTHTLKGVAGNLGLGRIYNILSDMVAKYRAGNIDGAIDEYPELEEAYNELCTIIQKYKENLA